MENENKDPFASEIIARDYLGGKLSKIDTQYLSVWNKFVANPNDQGVDGFASHQPVLVTLLQKLGGNARVIELGTGRGSSAIVAGLSSYSEHYETDLDWYNQMKELFETPEHIFKLVTNHEKYHWNEEEPFSKLWDVAFVDNAIGESRQSNLMKLSNKARFIVCHDTEEVYKPAASDYGWDFSSFKYHFVFRNYNTFTTVVSNFEDFSM